MTLPASSANPLMWWMQANIAAMNAAVDMTLATTKAVGAAYSSQERPAPQPTALQAYTPPSPARAAGRSWYRAPYRSPFDPMFWMSPGHPVDHISDWIAPSMALSASMGNPFAKAMTGGFGPWSHPAWMQPMTAWADLLSQHSQAAATAAATLPASNVVDFEKAFSAYRTAGGHASAQVLRGTSPETAEQSRLVEADERGAALWRMAFPFLPWTRLS